MATYQILDDGSEAQPTTYEILPDDTSSDGPGWFDSLTTSAEKGIGNIAEGLGGLIDYGETKIGTGTSLGQSILDSERKYQAPREELLSQVERGSPQFYANSALEGIITGLPMILSPSTLAAAGVGGALSGGQQFNRAQQLGADFDNAETSALLQGATGALSAIPVFQAAQGVGPLAQRALTSGLVNTATSIPSTISQAYADAIATQGQVQPYDLVEPIKENAITSAITGAAMPIAVTGARKLRGWDKPADLSAIRDELQSRFLNRPDQGSDAAPIAPEDPTQTLLPEAPSSPQASQDMATQPEVLAPQEPVQPPADPIATLKNKIDEIKNGIGELRPDLVDPEPRSLPEPNPIVETTEVVKAPNPDSESFPAPLKDVEAERSLTVQENKANPNDGPDIASAVEVDESAWARLAKKADELNITPLDPTQAWFQGQIRGRDVPVVSRVLATVRRNSMPRTISRKFPEAQDLYFKGGRAEVENEAMVASEMTELLRPYFKAENPKIVDGIIGQTRELTKQFQRERGQAIGKLKETLKRADDIMSGRVKLSGDVEGVKQHAEELAAEANKQLNAIKSREIPRLTEADMKAVGASDADIQAVLAHKDAMNYGLERLREALKLQGRKVKGEETKKQYDADVDEYINGMIDTNYFPARRYEDAWTVQIQDESGNTVFRTNAGNKGEAVKIAEQAKKDYRSAGKLKANVFANPVIDMDGFPDLPSNLADQLQQFRPEKYSEIAGDRPVRGWTRHLIDAQVVPGYDTDIRKSTIDYAVGLSKYYGRQHAKVILDDLITNLPEGSAIRGYATRYANEQLVKPEKPVTKAMLKFQNFMKLAGVPTSALINTSQTIVTTIPKLEGELIKAYGVIGAAKQTPKVFGKVTLQALSYLADRTNGKFAGKILRSKNPELFSFLDNAAKTGILDSEGLKELYNHRQKIQSNMTAADSLMFMFSTAEQANRTIALLAGREAGMAQGLKGDDLVNYAKDFVTSTQFDQTVANRPPAISHGVGRTLTQYRPFQLNYLRFVRDNLNKNDWPVVGLSLAAMMGLGGVMALPFSRDTERIAESLGMSPIKSFRKFVTNEKWADRLLYGLPMDAGVSISGAVGPGEFMSSDVSGQGLIKLFGPTADYIGNQIPKAYKALKEEDNPIAAFEIAGPRFARGPLKALRGLNQSESPNGGLQNYQGRTILPGVTNNEAGWLAFGATPARLQKQNELMSEEFRILNAANERPKDWNKLIANALLNKDQKRVRRLYNEIKDYNASLDSLDPYEKEVRTFHLNSNQIEKYMKQRALPQFSAILNAPNKAKPALVDAYRRYGKLQKRTPSGVEE